MTGRGQARRRIRPGFTLVELLVTLGIIMLLLGLVLPVTVKALGAARSFQCKIGLRTIASDFHFFAEDALSGNRGEVAGRPPSSRNFSLENFQESEYGIAEFWRWGERDRHTLPDAADNDPMRCASVGGEIVLRRNRECSRGGVAPPENISYTFNLRLHRASVYDENGRLRYVPVYLTAPILDEGMVPLAWDVDGSSADARGLTPVFSAPYVGPNEDPNLFWFPAMRHGGTANFAFIDGHVESSRAPLAEVTWAWKFQPR